MYKIYLVRHGENKANLTKEFSYKKVNYPLTLKGRLQAQQTADFFRGMTIEGVYASPLKRAVETAQYIAEAVNQDVQELENFRELNIGDLEDMPPTDENWEIHINVIREWLNGNKEACFPGGENYWMASERLMEGLKQVLSKGTPGGSYVIVGHGGIFLASIGELCPDLNIFEIIHRMNHNCAITEIDVSIQEEGLHGNLVRWADISHLYGDAADLVSGMPE